jgi:hypothetical protein
LGSLLDAEQYLADRWLIVKHRTAVTGEVREMQMLIGFNIDNYSSPFDLAWHIGQRGCLCGWGFV